MAKLDHPMRGLVFSWRFLAKMGEDGQMGGKWVA